MKSLSWSIFFSRWVVLASRVERIWVLAIDHLVVAAGVSDDGFVIDVAVWVVTVLRK